MNVVNRRIIAPIHRLEAPLVTLAIGSRFNSAAAHPIREDKGVVVPTQAALRTGHTAKLGGPYDQGVFKHASRLQVLDQAGNRLVDLSGHVRQFGVDVGMIVPVFAILSFAIE